MSVNDPLGDMLTRIRNAQMRKKGKVSTPGSRLRANVLDVLEQEGFIRGYTSTDHGNGRTEFDIELKYFGRRSGHQTDRTGVEAGPPRLRGRRRHAPRGQWTRYYDRFDAQGRHGRPCRPREQRRRRGLVQGLLTLAMKVSHYV